MIMDKLNEFADGVTLATATGIAAMGDSVDLGTARDIGQGNPLYLVIQIDTTVTSAGNATVEFRLVSDSVDPAATDGSATVHYTTGPIAKTELVAGKTVAAVALPLGFADYEQYISVQSNVGTAALTAGVASAFLTPDVSAWRALADGQN